MGDSFSIERQEFTKTPEALLILALISASFDTLRQDKAKCGQIMRGLLENYPGVLDALDETIHKQEGLSEAEKRQLRAVDIIYGISSGEPKEPGETAKEMKTSTARIRQLRFSGMNFLLNNVRVKKGEGTFPLSEILWNIRLRMELSHFQPLDPGSG